MKDRPHPQKMARLNCFLSVSLPICGLVEMGEWLGSGLGRSLISGLVSAVQRLLPGSRQWPRRCSPSVWGLHQLLMVPPET